MTSVLKKKTNRNNAQASTGPKTVDDVIPVGTRIKIAIASAPYYAPKLAPVKVPMSNAQAKVPSEAEIKAHREAQEAKIKRLADEIRQMGSANKAPADKSSRDGGVESTSRKKNPNNHADADR
jgi:hypothetical protein